MLGFAILIAASLTESSALDADTSGIRDAKVNGLNLEKLTMPGIKFMFNFGKLRLESSKCRKLSLKPGKPINGFKFINNPSSFVATLEQLWQSSMKAFPEVMNNMMYVEYGLPDISNEFHRVNEVLADHPDVVDLLKGALDQIKDDMSDASKSIAKNQASMTEIIAIMSELSGVFHRLKSTSIESNECDYIDQYLNVTQEAVLALNEFRSQWIDLASTSRRFAALTDVKISAAWVSINHVVNEAQISGKKISKADQDEEILKFRDQTAAIKGWASFLLQLSVKYDKVAFKYIGRQALVSLPFPQQAYSDEKLEKLVLWRNEAIQYVNELQ